MVKGLLHWCDRAGRIRIVADKRGVSAVEFALILPILLLLFFGTQEISQGMGIDRKVAHVSSALGDLVGQATTITNKDMTDILDAATSVVSPYPTAPLSIVVSQVKVDANGKATVDWSDARNGNALTKGASVTLPTNLNTPNTYLVMSQVGYPYTPTYGYVVTGTINFGEKTYFRPRRTSNIKRTT